MPTRGRWRIPTLKQAEILLHDAREAVAGCSLADATKLLGQLDVRVFLFLTGKTSIDKHNFKSLTEIGQASHLYAT